MLGFSASTSGSLSMAPSITGAQTPESRLGRGRTARRAAVPGMFTRLGVAFRDAHGSHIEIVICRERDAMRFARG
jgi:hypothetical protein